MQAAERSPPAGRAGLAPAQASQRAAASIAWPLRVLSVLSAYLPVLLMGLLALGTWWLVSNTPLLEDARVAAPPRHEPDYTMTRFSVHRFSPGGQMQARIEGDRLRHYPDTDTLEIDNVRIRAIAADGRVTLASATRALSNGDASEVQLLGGAHVVREAGQKSDEVHFRGEFLHAFFDTERVRSHLPVTVTRGATEVRADAMEYDHLAGVIRFSGRMRGVFEPRGVGR
jgi:lipopolysaccharide export system protein LptC